MSNVDQVIKESVEQFQAMANRLVEETAVAVREQLLEQIQSAAGVATLPAATPPKRKRGRPSKKEIAAREAAKAKTNGTNGTATTEKKPRKKRKPLSPENKAKLAENLRKAREAKKAKVADGSAEAQTNAE